MKTTKTQTNQDTEINALAKKLRNQKEDTHWTNTRDIKLNNIQTGLPFEKVELVRSSLQLTEQAFAGGLGLSRNTYAKHKNNKVLGTNESEKVFRYLRVLEQAFATFENKEGAKEWLTRHCISLGGVPAEVMLHEPGTTDTIETLKRIRYGVFA